MRCLLALLVIPAVAHAQDVRFARPPQPAAEGGAVRIEFAASAAIDCEVAILDAQGKVVRHLAAGVLGPNAPEPLRKDSLAQSLLWDKKDDLGRPASGGPFKVRVGLGLKPSFDKLIGFNPSSLGSIRGLACGPGGELYVIHVFGSLHPSDGTLSVAVLSREGKYLRTILPYPANLPAERIRGLKHLELAGGASVPFLYQAETRSLVPGAGDLPSQRPVVARDGRLAFVGIQELERYARAGVAQVVVIEKDGGIPSGGALKTRLAASSGTAASLALSPDGKTLYATGLGEGATLDGKPAQVVYAFGWDDPEPRIFAGEKGQAGAGEKRLNLPRSLATGSDGTVYVADQGNNRVAAFRPNGSFAGSIAVDKPERVEVHPGTGAVYVLGGPSVNVLQKFASLKDDKPAATATLPFFKHERYTAVLALDASAEPPVLWAATYQGYYARYGLLRIEDRGTTFGPQVDIAKNDGKIVSVGPVTEANLDPRSGRLYTGAMVFDSRTGDPLPVAPPKLGGSGPTNSMGRDGNYYAYHAYPSAAVSRFGPDLKPLPFEKSAKLEGLGSPRLRGRGIAADARGNVFVLWQKDDPKQTNALAVFGSDGALRNKTLVDADIRSLNSVRVDDAGNIYLALGLRPGKDLLPPALKGRAPDGKSDPDAVKGLNYYPLIYGSIAKFGPEGGEVRSGSGGVPCTYAWGSTTEVRGARWIFSGASNVPSWRTPGTPDICLCESLRFDVDGWGRTFFPDAGLFRVGMIDTNGNEIGWFGSYGNPDSGGPGSAVPTPEIPLWWPHAIAAEDGAVFVADRLNRRVVRVKLGYRAEATTPLP